MTPTTDGLTYESTSRTAKAGDLSLHYHEAGTGEPHHLGFGPEGGCGHTERAGPEAEAPAHRGAPASEDVDGNPVEIGAGRVHPGCGQ